MRCPTLNELPLSSEGKTGWPWTEESQQLPETMADGSPWPKISIISPNYNYGQYIEETIRSVLLQGYPDIEYIIIDDSSTDDSLSIINKYKPWVICQTRQKKGQSTAINEGVKQSSGQIVAWINSDDLYLPDVFGMVARLMYHQGRNIKPVIYGSLDIFSERPLVPTGKHQAQPADFDKLLAIWDGGGMLIPQTGLFMRSDLFKNNPLSSKLNYIMDYELWLRLAQQVPFYCVEDQVYGAFRSHPLSKTCRKKTTFDFDREFMLICPLYWGKGSMSYWHCLRKFWQEYMAKRYLLWPTKRLLQRCKNNCAGWLIKCLGQERYDRLKNSLK